ncbi:ABC transporter permease [Ethanoligenens sp.]|uniref:ABC transporter permease n=1 Tax=Ethanoligenens sp. TaxID=2099655 RepID=UPI0039ECF473
MRVYKTCFQVIWKRLPALFIYLFIFLALAIMLSKLNNGSGIMNFTATKSNVVIYNNDGNSAISAGLKDYLAKNAVLVSVPDNKRAIQDALFFYQADSILRIPSGFSKDLTSGTAKISRSSRSDSTSSIYTDYLVNRYLNLANLYAQSLPNLSEEQIATQVSATLQKQSTVSLHTFGQKDTTSTAAYYFRYLVYALIAILILSTSTVLFTFQKTDLRRRNLCAPIAGVSTNIQQMLAVSTFGLVVWAIMCGLGIAMNIHSLNATAALLYLVNSLAVMLVGLGIGFLVSNLVKTDQAASAASNVVTLGMSFLCGVFIPQDMLSSSVLNAAHFLPAYWYVRAVDTIDSLSVFTVSSVTPIIQDVLIQVAFAVAFCAISLLLYRQKQMSSN